MHVSATFHGEGEGGGGGATVGHVEGVGKPGLQAKSESKPRYNLKRRDGRATVEAQGVRVMARSESERRDLSKQLKELWGRV